MMEESGILTGVYRLEDPDFFHPVAQADAPELAQLAQGMLEAETESSLREQLGHSGLLAPSEEPDPDPVIEALLQKLGAPFSWRVWEQHRKHLEAVRRWHAHRKLFLYEYGQTPCLPETVLARAQQTSTDLATNAHILLIGDDDLMCVAFALLGYSVTVVDIDPSLIDFIQRRARLEGLSIEAKVVDLLQPVPPEMVGRFDRVLTDPMSFEGCLIAFLSRALAMVKNDGQVWTCVHPLAHPLFAKVAHQLPAHIHERAAWMSAYYYRRYQANTYRSDLFCLTPTGAALPFQADEHIPFESITEGELIPALHGHVFCRLTASENPENASFEHLAESAVLEQDQTHQHFFKPTTSGYVAGTINRRGNALNIQLFPFSERHEEQLSAEYLENLNPIERRVHYMEAPILAPSVFDKGQKSN